MKEEILKTLSEFNGKVSLYYKNLVSGEVIAYNENAKLEAASVIKLAVLYEIFKQSSEGRLNLNEKYVLKEEDKLPSCGALTYLKAGLEVTIEDLCVLMIILSDNTAANLLIKKAGMDNINLSMKELGFNNTVINRLLFDSVLDAKGVQNYTSAYDMGVYFEKLYNGELINKDICEKMLEMLKNQRLNGKIPFYFHSYTDFKIAHKTGEDSGITHDVGIVYADEPFIICFMSNEVDVPKFEKLIQDISWKLYKRE